MKEYTIRGAKTVEQYKILEYLHNNFHMEDVETKLINENCIQVTDKKEDILYFSVENEEIVHSENKPENKLYVKKNNSYRINPKE